jgi:hypothetical protein
VEQVEVQQVIQTPLLVAVLLAQQHMQQTQQVLVD